MRRAPRKEDSSNAYLSIRFKHGATTVLLLVNPLEPFSKITAELLETLRERYPNGLSSPLVTPSKRTAIPDTDSEVKVVYGLLKIPADPSQGWKTLDVSEDGTPASKGLKNNAVVAFDLLGPGKSCEDVSFAVEFPQLDPVE